MKKMQHRYKLTFLTALLLFVVSINAQDQKVVFKSKTKACLVTDGEVTDSIVTMNFYRKNQFMKVRDGKLYVFRAIVPGVDNFEGIYYKIDEYTVQGDTFHLIKSLPVFREIHVPLKFRLRKKGIKISYSKKFLKRWKDVITYEQFEHTASYVIKSKQTVGR